MRIANIAEIIGPGNSCGQTVRRTLGYQPTWQLFLFK